jgi:hypothetical protein
LGASTCGIKIIRAADDYYLILFGGAWLVIHNNPECSLPADRRGGSADQSGGGKSNASSGCQAHEVKTSAKPRLDVVAIIGALITSLPVTWVYMATRTATNMTSRSSARS